MNKQQSRLGKTFSGFAAAFLMLSISVGASADDSKLMDEKANALLKSMSDFIGKAQTLSFRTRTFFDVVRESGIQIKVGRANQVRLKRPDKLQLHSVSEDGQATTAWFDGSKMTIWTRHANEVSQLEFSGTTDKLIDELVEKHKAVLPTADLLFSDVAAKFKENMISSEYLGLRTVGGVKCHHLSFESTGADWQIWIRADQTPLPCRFVINYVEIKGEPGYMAQFENWSVGGEMDDSLFTAAVPDEVKKVKFEAKTAQ